MRGYRYRDPGNTRLLCTALKVSLENAGQDVSFRNHHEYTELLCRRLSSLRAPHPYPPSPDLGSSGGLMSMKLLVGNISSVALEDGRTATSSQCDSANAGQWIPSKLPMKLSSL